jgi:hypothetical protein
MDLNFNSFDDIPIPLRVAFIGVICALLFYFAYMFDFSYTLRVIIRHVSRMAGTTDKTGTITGFIK